jgi:hypothetical protein
VLPDLSRDIFQAHSVSGRMMEMLYLRLEVLVARVLALALRLHLWWGRVITN